MSHANINNVAPLGNKYVSLDIERTGDTEKDVTFAIGIHVQTDDDKCIRSQNFCLYLGKVEGETWEELWKRKEYSQVTFSEFWSKQIPVLEKLQNGECWYSTEKAFTDAFMEYLHAEFLDTNYTVQLLFDTSHYDAVYLTILATRHGYPPIHVAPNGTIVKAWNVGSYESGVAGVLHTHTREERRALCAPIQNLGMPDLTPHNPADDAKKIYYTFVNASKQNKKKKRERLDLFYIRDIPIEARYFLYHLNHVFALMESASEVQRDCSDINFGFDQVVAQLNSYLTTVQASYHGYRQVFQLYSRQPKESFTAPFDYAMENSSSEKKAKYEQTLRTMNSLLLERDFIILSKDKILGTNKKMRIDCDE